jgi:subtilisin family serine protease
MLFNSRRPHLTAPTGKFRKQKGRAAARSRFLALAILIALATLLASGFGRSRAQNANESPDAAFAKKADKILKLVRRAATADRLPGDSANRRTAVEEMSDSVAIERRADGVVAIDVAVTLAGQDTSEVLAAGFPVASRIGDIATLSVEVDRLPDLAALASVRKISASDYRHPLNDRARQASGVDNSSGQRVVSQTGQGIVVGIIDTGIDFRHLDFTVPGSGGHQTRIKAMLDMTVYGSAAPDPNWNYTLPGQSAVIGHFYSEADINSSLQIAKPLDQNTDLIKERDKSGHGTHVAGTAAGNGLSSPTPGTYAGMAPDADLIIVKASRQNDGHDSFRVTDVINALEFVRQKAAEQGKPFVINLSLGSQGGPHDGTNPDERAIDALVNGGSGRAVCVAAGNEGDAGIHARATVPAGGTQTLDLNVNDGPEFVDLYQANSDRFSVTVTRPDGTVLGPVAFDVNGLAQLNGQASDQYLQIYNGLDDKGDADPNNDQPDVFLLFKPGAPNGAWKITLQDADSNANGSFDAWAEGADVSFSLAEQDNGSHLVASPGTSRAAITVGAFVTRSTTQPIGAAAPFTSPGPTADGRSKPDISAPGYYLYSARSTDIAVTNFGTIGTGANAPTDSTHYTGLAGTSMATPVTTGAIALLLQANPGMSSDQMKDALWLGANHDQFDSLGWNPWFGKGKLNIATAIESASGDGLIITGRVLDASQNPAAGVPLLLRYFDTSQHELKGQTNANGILTFKKLQKGLNYYIGQDTHPNSYYVVSPDGFQFFNLSSSQTATFSAQVRTYLVGGRVVDQFNNAVGGVAITRTRANSSQVLTTVTQPVGSFVFNEPATMGETITLTAAKPGLRLSPASIVFTLSGPPPGIEFTAAPANPIDVSDFFVKQQYLDFLNRPADQSGLDFWVGNFTPCGSNAQCIDAKRINVTAAFFLSIEFQDTGYLVERIYKAAYGDASGSSTFGGAHTLSVPIIRLNEFLPDTQAIGQGVIVGQGTWQLQIENNKQAFTAEFVQRPRFNTAFPNTLTAAQFVDKLNTNAGNPLSPAERDQLVSDLSTNAKTRAQVLRVVAEDPDLNSAESNRAFVLMQFFGYLRRNPNDAPDSDYTGYDFWLTKLNQFNGNFVNADMVKAFISSSEYRQRFGP